jgi:heme iron utilization protein
MPSMSDQARTARMLLKRQSVGVLSTHSVEVEGYPFGSIAPYVLNYDGEPTMLISDIAQHTRNIKHNKKVSLTIFDQCVDDPQASSRLTWIGNAESGDPSDTKIRHRYLRIFLRACHRASGQSRSLSQISFEKLGLQAFFTLGEM